MGHKTVPRAVLRVNMKAETDKKMFDEHAQCIVLRDAAIVDKAIDILQSSAGFLEAITRLENLKKEILDR